MNAPSTAKSIYTSKLKKPYIVTTSTGGVTRSQIWDSQSPLPLGHPFRWIVERTDKGVRVRNISSVKNQLKTGGFQELTHEALESGTNLELPEFGERPSKPPVLLSIRPVAAFPPIYKPEPGTLSKSSMSVYSCIGSWVLESAPIDTYFVGREKKKRVFTLRKKTEGYEVEFHLEGVELGEKKYGKDKIQLKPDSLIDSSISFGNHSWRFGLLNPVTLSESSFQAKVDEDSERFFLSLKYAAAAFAVFTATAWLWPKPLPVSNDVIPPQFTKLVLQKPSQKSQSAANEAPAKIKQVKKAQETAVVQAFRAKALKNAISGLLKGGMTRLLEQSDFVVGPKTANDSRKIFDTHSSALVATAPLIGSSADKNIAVAAIGGNGSRFRNGKAVGYGKGNHAEVNGQGKSFVSMDIVGSSVEEGLTKDEVGEIIHRHLSEVRYCYESAMLHTPDLEGKLLVNFTIAGTGAVKTSEIKSSTLPDPRVDDCVLRRLVTWRFPQTKGGVDVAVSYPFIFKTLGR